MYITFFCGWRMFINLTYPEIGYIFGCFHAGLIGCSLLGSERTLNLVIQREIILNSMYLFTHKLQKMLEEIHHTCTIVLIARNFNLTIWSFCYDFEWFSNNFSIVVSVPQGMLMIFSTPHNNTTILKP
jgi:hypothetical protein